MPTIDLTQEEAGILSFILKQILYKSNFNNKEYERLARLWVKCDAATDK